MNEPKRTQFRKQLEQIINCHSVESGSDTPDFILAEYLTGCLEAYDKALARREEWYGRGPSPATECPSGPACDNLTRCEE